MRVLTGAALRVKQHRNRQRAAEPAAVSGGRLETTRRAMNVSRAFHSATILPKRRRFTLGGIEAVSGYGPDIVRPGKLGRVSTTRWGTFIALSGPAGGLTPRAFHQAAVLSATDTQGGIRVRGGDGASPVCWRLPAPNSASLIRFACRHTGAALAGPDSLVYDIPTRTISSSSVQGSSRTPPRSAAARARRRPGCRWRVDLHPAAPSLTAQAPPRSASSVRSPFAPPGAASGEPCIFTAGCDRPWSLGRQIPLSASPPWCWGAQVPEMVTDPANMLALPVTGCIAGPTLSSNTVMGFTDDTRRRGFGADRDGDGGGEHRRSWFHWRICRDRAAAVDLRASRRLRMSRVRLYTVSDPAGAVGLVCDQHGRRLLPAHRHSGTADGLHYRPRRIRRPPPPPRVRAKSSITGGTPHRASWLPASDRSTASPPDPATKASFVRRA